MKPKPRPCRERAEGCHGEYIPRSSFQTTCGNIACALQRARKDREKLEAKKARARRAETRAEKQALKGIREWSPKAQEWCNRYIRLRDKDEPCISCGKTDNDLSDRFGGKWDAGHFLTRGSRRWLRFHPYMVHKQCKSCNNPGPFKAGQVARQYRENLIKKVGLEMVEYLENNHDSYSFTVEDLQEIIAEYRERIKLTGSGR